MSRGLSRPIDGAPERSPHAASVAVVALGANLGDREQTLEEAVRDIARLPLVDAITVSRSIETVAVTVKGPDEQAPAYLNAVALVTTRLAPSVLLALLHRIEAAHGRERRERWGDRTLDLDLVAYGDVIADTPELTLPHPRAAERAFVLGPWLAVDPDAVLPGHGRVDELLAGLGQGGHA
ncbi:MAG TPA: 2-amino-4-hydroxy-6-hydroxymethyldihydropteridine diphosphokinase [Microbacterium sp.]|nr:2-amino-4-hydroxy-6-hydroxymethyldihydropteridine diphosphokinase [Microbacterium sp.]